MTNKIMELVRRVLVSESNEDLNLIQDEVTRMEAELAGSILERNMLMQSITDPENQPSQHGTVTLEYHEAVSQERDALRAKLAALEAQEPVAEYIRHEGWYGLVKYLVNRGPLLKPGDKLYLAPGAGSVPMTEAQNVLRARAIETHSLRERAACHYAIQLLENHKLGVKP